MACCFGEDDAEGLRPDEMYVNSDVPFTTAAWTTVLLCQVGVLLVMTAARTTVPWCQLGVSPYN